MFFMCQEIDLKFGKTRNLNIRKNQANVAASVGIYRSRMTALVAPGALALHPQHLQEEHEEAVETALNEFNAKRVSGEDIEETDEYRNTIHVVTINSFFKKNTKRFLNYHNTANKIII